MELERLTDEMKEYLESEINRRIEELRSEEARRSKAREEGLAEGIAKGRFEFAKELVAKGSITLDEAASHFGMSPAEFFSAAISNK